jgi:uncharacterized protein (DUF885 family)
MRQRLLYLVVLLAMTYGCGSSPKFSTLEEEFVYTALSFSPVSASAAGLHNYKGANLDRMLDDISPAGIDGQRRFYRQFRERLSKLKREKLDPEEQADLDIIQDQISLSLLDLDTIQTALHNPTYYVELIGNALFNPWVLEYAPKTSRMQDLIARLRLLPVFVDQIKVNLVSSPAIWTKVAQEENAGNIDLLQNTITPGIPNDQRKEFDTAAKPALKALQDLQDYLKNHLSERDDYDWRLGRDHYAQKFRYALETDLDPTVLLEQAERDMQSVRKRMYELALPLYRKANASGNAEDQGHVIATVLGKIAERHSKPESYFDDARRDLDEARAFVQAKHLLTLPSRSNLQVIETPEFMRGIYAVGGFNPAPALEPQLGAFYWITPIPKSWPPERVQSKLREYNFYNLKLLTIHEAMPGHYVQFEIANDIQPKSRRLLRSVFGNGPYIEGWAQYATQAMLDSGFLDNSPELRLTFQKQELRVLANAIIDVRLHTLNMTDQEAIDLMEKQTFQETEEATAKLQRAKLSSCQLPTYLAGWRGWIQARDQYQKTAKPFKLEEFHDRALRQGAVPLPVLERLLAARPTS